MDVKVQMQPSVPPAESQRQSPRLPTIPQLRDNIKQRQILMQDFYARKDPPLEPRITGWATLPMHILQQIFKHLDHHHLITFCTLVCKYWRRAILTDSFMTTLSITKQEAPLSFIYNYLREFKHLNSLTLNNVYEMESILIQARKVCGDLKCIALTNYEYIGYNVLTFLTKNFPNLRGLSFAASNVVCQNISSDITMFVNLEKLNLFNVRAQGLNKQGIIEIVLNCRELNELNIGLCQPMLNLEDDDVLVVLTNLAAKLTSLSLDSRKLTMRSLEKLRECKQLRRLHIKYAVNMTGDFLVDFLPSLHSIHELGFTHNCIVNGCDISMMISDGKEVFRDLLILDLTYCVQLGDVALETIENVCKKLQKLLLKCCMRLTSIEPILECKWLRYLDLAYCAQLIFDFNIPTQLEVLVIDNRQGRFEKLRKLNSKYLKIFLSVSEYTDHIEPY